MAWRARPPDEHASVIELGVRWDPGATSPHLLQSERRTLLAFYIGPTDPAYTDVLADVGVIEWRRCRGAILGSPNIDALHGHRLWHKGLREAGHYGAAEVRNSAWIAATLRVLSAHEGYDSARWRGLRHFILSFHDSTFESALGNSS